jgi:hypothetical protein
LCLAVKGAAKINLRGPVVGLLTLLFAVIIAQKLLNRVRLVA